MAMAENGAACNRSSRGGHCPCGGQAIVRPRPKAHSKVMEQADSRDIQAALAGDGEAYGHLVRRYQNAVAQRMWRFTRDPRQIEELVQDVFVEAYVSLRNFRGAAPFEHWLNRIATRVGYRYWRTRRRRRAREAPLQDWNQLGNLIDDRAAAAASAAEAAEMLHVLLGQLRPRDRLVLTLLYVEDLTVAEAAERTGWSKVMVKVQAHRARKRLRAVLDKRETPRQQHRETER